MPLRSAAERLKFPSDGHINRSNRPRSRDPLRSHEVHPARTSAEKLLHALQVPLRTRENLLQPLQLHRRTSGYGLAASVRASPKFEHGLTASARAPPDVRTCSCRACKSFPDRIFDECTRLRRSCGRPRPRLLGFSASLPPAYRGVLLVRRRVRSSPPRRASVHRGLCKAS